MKIQGRSLDFHMAWRLELWYDIYMGNTTKLQNLFLIAIVIGLLHVLEQWFFGFELAFADLEKKFLNFQGLFDNPDKAFLVLVTILLILWMTTIYFLLRGGKWRGVVPLIFGFIYISEIHHLISAFEIQAYYPGAITGTFMFFLGVIFLKKSIKFFGETSA